MTLNMGKGNSGETFWLDHKSGWFLLVGMSSLKQKGTIPFSEGSDDLDITGVSFFISMHYENQL